jgi:hypothetical protein
MTLSNCMFYSVQLKILLTGLIQKEVDVPYFKILSQQFCAGTVENHEKPQSGWVISRTEIVIRGLPIWHAYHSTRTFGLEM